jgi:hypothetical protein
MRNLSQNLSRSDIVFIASQASHRAVQFFNSTSLLLIMNSAKEFL